MIKPALLAAAAALAAAPAFAQAPPAPQPAAPPQPGVESAAPAGPDGSVRRDGPRPAGGRGATFRIERGDLELTVRCADGDTTRACGEIVSQMLDKLGTSPAAARTDGRSEGRSGLRDDDRSDRSDRSDRMDRSDGDRRERRWRDY